MRFWFLLLLGFAACMLESRRALAAEVVLLHPASADPFLEEVYHRVRGELRVQAIEFEQEEAGVNGPTESAVQALLGRNDARACISFNWQGEATVIRVWVIQSAGTPPDLLEAVALKRNAEAPTLLAARAVDLMRSALKRVESVPAPSPPAPVVHSALAAPKPPTPRLWLIGAAVNGLDFPSGAGHALGPEFSLTRRMSAQLGLGLHIAAPLLGARVQNSEASARLVQGVATLRLDAELLRVGPLELSAVGGTGLHFLRANGSIAQGIGSLAARSDQRISFSLLAGAEGAFELSPSISLVLGASALVLLPAPRIALGRGRESLGGLGLLWSVGVQFSL